METVVISKDQIDLAVNLLRGGEVVAFCSAG